MNSENMQIKNQYYDVDNKMIKHIEYINNILNNNLYKKHDIIINKYKIIKRFTTFICLKCTFYSEYFGYCISHHEQNELNNDIDDFYNNYISGNNKIEIRKCVKHIINLMCEIKSKLINIINFYYINICYDKYKITTLIPLYFKFDDLDIKDYDKYNIIFDNTISKNILSWDNNNIINETKIIILSQFLFGIVNYNINYISNILYNFNKQKILHTKLFIGNNNILFKHIVNSHLNKYIEFISTEQSLRINKSCYRIDLYILLNIDNTIFELCIETDEHHHHNKIIKSDIIKNNFMINKNISFIRITINKHIVKKNINFILFCIEYIVHTKKPLYYFSNEYIENNNKYINNTIENNMIITFGLDNIEHKLLKTIENKSISTITNYDEYIKNIDIDILKKN